MHVETPWARKVEIKVKYFERQASSMYSIKNNEIELYIQFIELIQWAILLRDTYFFGSITTVAAFELLCITDRTYKIILFLYLFQLYALRTSRKEIVDFSKAILK